jgi:hypothetical protein
MTLLILLILAYAMAMAGLRTMLVVVLRMRSVAYMNISPCTPHRQLP